VNTVTSLGAGGLKDRRRITGKVRDFATLHNAQPKGQGMHDLVFDSGQGKETDKTQTIRLDFGLI